MCVKIELGGMFMTISFKVSDNTKEKMVEYFQDKKEKRLLLTPFFKRMKQIR